MISFSNSTQLFGILWYRLGRPNHVPSVQMLHVSDKRHAALQMLVTFFYIEPPLLSFKITSIPSNFFFFFFFCSVTLIMEPRKAFLASPFSFVLIFFFLTISLYGGKASSEEQHATLVEKGQRRPLVVSEYGEVSAIDVKVGDRAPLHHLQFITLDPNSVFLPVLLHVDMVFYVHTGEVPL